MNPDLEDRLKALSPEKLALLEKLLREKGLDAGGRPSLQPRRNPQDSAPMSFSQQRLWFFDQFDPGNSIYNGPMFYRIRGRLDVPALEASLGEVVRRHEILRTNFTVQEDDPLQVIRQDMGFRLEIVDLSSLSPADREKEAKRRGREEKSHAFDLARAPLFRAMLLRLDEEEFVLLMTAHHIVFDGWSTGVLWQELAALYPAFSENRPSPLAELPVQYADYAQWQRNWFAGVELERQLNYWKRQLEGVPALELPSDRPRPPVQTYRGGSHSHLLSDRLASDLQALARLENASDYMIMLALLKVLLARQAGQTDIAVGSPIAGRQCVETEELIGMFVNTLVIRTSQKDAPTFRDLLRRVRQAALHAYQHQDLPFEKLVMELHPQRDLSRTPVFQVMFNAMNFSHQGPELPGLELEEFSIHEKGQVYDPGAKFDLTLYAIRGRQGTRLVAAYNADLYAHERMAGFLDQFEALARQVVADPDRPVGHYSLITEPLAGLCPPSNAGPGPAPEVSFLDQVAQQAARDPARTAVVDAGGTWTYGELDAASDRLVHYLRRLGVDRGQVVAIHAQRSAALVWAILGVLKAGCAFTILDSAHPFSRLNQCLSQSGAAALLDLVEAGSNEPETWAGPARHIRATGDPRRSGPWVECPSEPPAFQPEPADLAYVAFTSGTTGAPRGILGTHEPLSHFLAWQTGHFPLGSEDRFSLLSGLSHDPLLRDIFTPLCLGAALHVPRSAEIQSGHLGEWMRSARITVAHLTPAMAEVLCASLSDRSMPADGNGRLDLRYAFFGGDCLTMDQVRRLETLAPSVRCVNFYGATETPQAVGYFAVPPSRDALDPSPSPSRVPLGRGVPGAELQVVNASGTRAGLGELGEIVVRSPYLAKGYLNDPALTRAKFQSDASDPSGRTGLYFTGDLGRYLADGTVVYVGRADRQVKIRGFRVELNEVQAVLSRFPGVESCVAVLRQDEGPACLAAYYTSGADPRPGTGALRAFLEKQLPEYMVPTLYVLLEAIPLTPSGKVNEQALPAPERSRPEGEAHYTAPRSDLEREIGVVWQDILGLERVGTMDNFFDLGGHSLLVVKLQTRLQEHLDREIRLVDLFKFPTIMALAGHLSGATPSATSTRPVTQRVRREKSARMRQGHRLRQIRKDRSP